MTTEKQAYWLGEENVPYASDDSRITLFCVPSAASNTPAPFSMPLFSSSRPSVTRSTSAKVFLLVLAIVGIYFLHTHHVSIINTRSSVDSLDVLRADGWLGLTPNISSDGSVAIISLYFGKGNRHQLEEDKYHDLYTGSLQVLQTYAAKWGYPLHIGKDEIMKQPVTASRKGLLTKEALVMSIILTELRKPKDERKLEWIYFVDADAVLVNHNVPLDIFFPPDDSHFLLVSFDQFNTMNSGGFMIRVCEDSIRFLASMIAESVSLGARWEGSDQALMAKISKRPEFIKQVAIVPAHWFNADALYYFYPSRFPGREPTYQYGDFMVHFMGGTKYKNGWKEILTSAQDQTNSTTSLKLEDTRYIRGQDSVESFWQSWFAMPSEQRISRVRSCNDVWKPH